MTDDAAPPRDAIFLSKATPLDDEFALWLDGADELAAAERAEELRIATPVALAETTEGTGLTLGMSIGIATRWPGRGEALEALIQRADQAMYHVKRSGRGHWHVARPEPRG